MKPAATTPQDGDGPAWAGKAGGANQRSQSGPALAEGQTKAAKSPSDAVAGGDPAVNVGGFGGGKLGANALRADIAPPTMVVSLNISTAAVQQKAFERLLTRLGMIDLQDPAAARRNRGGGYVQQNLHGNSLPPSAAAKASSVPPLVYDIDASSAQLFEVLRQIAQRPDVFSSPVIQAAPPPANVAKAADIPESGDSQSLGYGYKLRAERSPKLADLEEERMTDPAQSARGERQVADKKLAKEQMAEENTATSPLRETEKRSVAKSEMGTLEPQQSKDKKSDAEQAQTVPTQRVRFVLQVVDRVSVERWNRAAAAEAEYVPPTPAAPAAKPPKK
jgi:hypothetical protein